MFGWIGFYFCFKWLKVYWNPLHCKINRQIKSKIDGMNGNFFEHVLNTQSSLVSMTMFFFCDDYVCIYMCVCAVHSMNPSPSLLYVRLFLFCIDVLSKLLNWHYVTRVHRIKDKSIVSTACSKEIYFCLVVPWLQCSNIHPHTHIK